jgi:hypothetical protein
VRKTLLIFPMRSTPLQQAFWVGECVDGKAKRDGAATLYRDDQSNRK